MFGPYERAVYYYETDRMQIVHHSNYIKWMEEARTWYLDEIGVPYHEMEAAGIMIPVLSVNVEYRKAFVFGDVFQIYIKPVKFNGVKGCFEYEIRNKATGELHSTGSSSHCFVTTDLKPLNMKKVYPDFYNKMHAPLEAEA